MKRLYIDGQLIGFLIMKRFNTRRKKNTVIIELESGKLIELDDATTCKKSGWAFKETEN